MKRLGFVFCVLFLCEYVYGLPAHSVPPTRQKQKDSLSSCRKLVWESSVDDEEVDLLTGITCLTIAVQRNHPFLPHIDFEKIRTALETKCREAGLRVTNAEDSKTPMGRAINFSSRCQNEGVVHRYVGELKASQESVENDFLDSLDYFIGQWKKANGR